MHVIVHACTLEARTHAQLKIIQKQDDLGAESGSAGEKSIEEANRIPQDEKENMKQNTTNDDGMGKENTGSISEEVRYMHMYMYT